MGALGRRTSRWRRDVLQLILPVLAFLAVGVYSELRASDRGEDSQQPGDREVPLAVVRTVPAAIAAGGTASVAGSDPLLVVFSRPVFPLGASLAEAGAQAAKAPFSLSPSVVGNWTWVSTYEARWDVSGESWPFNQRLTIRWNEYLTTFDDVALAPPAGGGAEAVLITQACELLDVQMRSDAAASATGSFWAADWAPVQAGALEFPPDGKLMIELTCPVELEAAAQALMVFHVNPETLEVGEQAEGVTMTTEDYAVGIAAGSTLGSSVAHLASDIGVLISGLHPFQFWAPQEQATRYNRLDLFLRHGMEASTAETRLIDLIHLRSLAGEDTAAPIHGSALALNISFPMRKAASSSTGPVLRLATNLRPDTWYELQIDSSQEVVDMFGLPMEAFVLRFQTQPAPAIFEPLQAGYDKRANFESLSSWPIISRGAPEAFKLWPVRESCQEAAAVASMYSAQALEAAANEQCPLLGFATATGAHNSPSPTAAGLHTEAQHLLDGRGLFLSQKESVERHSYGQMDLTTSWRPMHGGGDVTVVQRATVALSAITSGEELAVWATTLRDGSPVPGANVTLYRLINDDAAEIAPTEAVKTATTDQDGLAIFSFPPDDDLYHRPGHGLLTVALSSGGDTLLLDNVPPPAPAAEVYTSGALLFDRSAIAPGNTLHVKGVARQLQPRHPGTGEPQWGPATMGRFELWLDVETQFGTVMTFQPPMGPPTRLSLDLDPEFGGFEEAVEVPLDIDVSVKSFSFRLMWLQQDAVAQQVRLAGNGAPAAAILWPSLASEPATRESRNGGYDPDGMRRPPSDVAGRGSRANTDKDHGGLHDDFMVLDIRTSVERPLPGQSFGVAVCVLEDSGGRIQSQLACAQPARPLQAVVTFESEDGDPLGSCLLPVGGDMVTAFNACRLMVPADASPQGLTLMACPAGPGMSSVGRKLRMGDAGHDLDVDCEYFTVFPRRSGSALTEMPSPEVSVIQQEGGYALGDEVSISIDTPSMGAAALLRWGFGHRWQSVMAPLRRGFSLVPFRLGPECSLGVCEFYLTIHIPRQDPRAGGWAGPQLPLSKLLDPLAPYSVRQVLRVPFTPRPPASLPLSLRLLGAAPPGAGSGWVARTGERAQVWVGLEAEAADGAEVVIMVVEANSCMRSSNSHLVAPGADDAALRAALRYMRIDPWLDPAATSDKVKLSLLSLFPGPPTDAPESSERFLAAVDMAREDFLQQYTDCLTFFPIMYGGENSGRAATGRSCLPPPLRLRPGSTLRPLLADERPTAHVPQSAGQGGRDAAVPLSSGRTLAQNITIAMAASQRHETGASSGGPAEAEPRVAFTLDTDLPRKRHPGATQPAKRHHEGAPPPGSGGDPGAPPLLMFQSVRLSRGHNASIPLSLPDAPGEYRVIAVAIGRGSAFGLATADLSVQAAMSLSAVMPEVVHAGDAFQLRVHVQAASNASEPIMVEVSVLEGGLQLLTPGAALLHPKDGGGEVRMRLKATAPGDSTLRLAASGAEPRLLRVPVQPVGKPLQLFESFNIGGSTPTRETAVELGSSWAAPDSNLSIAVAGDHLPVLLGLAHETQQASSPAALLSSERLLAQLVPAAVLPAYQESSPDSARLQAALRAARGAAAAAVSELQRRTVDCCGLLPSGSAPLRADLRLTAWALWLVRQLSALTGAETVPARVTDNWRRALTRGAVRELRAAEPALPRDVLLAVRLGLAPAWELPVCAGDASEAGHGGSGGGAECVSAATAAAVRGSARTADPVGSLGLLGVLHAGLAALDGPQPADGALLSRVLGELGDSVRLRSSATGGFLADQDGSSSHLDDEAAALALYLTAQLQRSHRGGGPRSPLADAEQLLEWLGEAVAQRGGGAADGDAFLLPSSAPPPRALAAMLLSLAAYDGVLAGRVGPGSGLPRAPSRLTLHLGAADQVLTLWESGGGGLAEVSVAVGGLAGAPLSFRMSGPARAAVALSLRLQPVAPPPGPLRRGVLVTAAWLNATTGAPAGRLCLGEVAKLVVTLSVADPLEAVEVVVPMPGGMLASDASVAPSASASAAAAQPGRSRGGARSTCGPSNFRPLSNIYACPSFVQRPTLVLVHYATLPRGTTTVEVDAAAAYLGQFVSPPVVATAVNDPSIMGASAAAPLSVGSSC
eukprot:jgi/Tetstr1/466037/TSEL_010625.t2